MEEYGRNFIEVNSSSSASAVKISSGTPNLGEYRDKGYNDIRRGTGYCVENLTGGEIMAEKNYWGSFPPSSSWFYGNVAWDFPLRIAPTAGSSLDKPIVLTEDRFILEEALALLRNKDYSNAARVFKELIEEYPDSRFAGMALAWAMGAYTDIDKLETQCAYLNQMRYHQNEKVARKALLWLESLESWSGNKQASKIIVDAVPINDPIGIEIRLNFADNLLNIYGDKEASNKVFDDIIKYDASESIVEAIAAIKSDLSFDNELHKPLFPDTELEHAIPDEYRLSYAYPNPFNPSTTIKYDIPNISDVTVRIFNILGQTVKSYAIASQSPGTYEITWDGTNTTSVQVPSGVYIVHFSAESLEGKREVYQKPIKITLLR